MQDQTKLMRRDTLIAHLFPEEDRPSVRTFESWKARRMIPYVKLGGFCYYDPAAVRDALAKKFTINAVA